MSVTTKKKYVIDEVLNNYEEPSEGQTIVKVASGRGNNLHEVVTPEGDSFLASMPSKFRKNIWIKRGDYVIIEPITEGLKVKAEIVQILLKDQIKYFKSIGIWPKEFEEDSNRSKGVEDDDDDDDCDNLFVNDNRHNLDIEISSSDESSSEEACSGDEEEEENEGSDHDCETNSRDKIM